MGRSIGRFPLSTAVFLHIGVAKTGTTYLQRTLHTNRDVLRKAGLLYPGTTQADHFVAALDLRDVDDERFGHLTPGGRWDALAQEAVRFRGTAVISHETLARCRPAEIRRAVRSFGDADVRVVLTVRDLGRQIPAVWQETLKNRATDSYEDFLTEVFVNVGSGEHRFFWKPQNVAKVVRRWSRQVGAENVTVVTVPPSGAPRGELWDRFARAIELPDVAIALPELPTNSSLGPAEAELLRYVNVSLPDQFPWPRYDRAIKRRLAESRLAERSSERIVVPPQWHDATKAWATEINSYLESSGVVVIGDLAELEPQLPVVDVSGPDDDTRERLLVVAGDVIRDLTLDPLPRKVARATRSDRPGLLSGFRARLGRLRRRVFDGR